MHRSVLLLLTLFVIILNCGCGTVRNVQQGGEAYGGVKMECQDWCGGGQNGGFAGAVLWPFWLMDKPLSLVGDTVTLPLCLANHASDSSRRGD